MNTARAAYLELFRTGQLKERVETAQTHLRACDLCGRLCEVDRIVEKGACRTGERAVVASFGPHFGEEDPLRGSGGSGTIFFSWCNLHCQYCQNADISQGGRGQALSPEELAQMMLSLQDRGCHNINLVSPTHVTPQILAALLLAAERGLRLPLVWNTGGYDSLDTLALLEGVVDIYMPDMKYADEAVARRYSKVPNYPQVNQEAVQEMHRQVGDLALNKAGVARRGMLVRHLVLPQRLAGTEEIARFLAEHISPNTYVNIMAQYRPRYRAHELPPLDRPITRREYEEALAAARAAGLHRLDRRNRR